MKLKRVTLISILNGLFLMFLTLLEFFGVMQFGLIVPYHWHKILHILGVVMFMGNMVVGPVWFLFAYYSKDKNLLKFANKLLQLTDIYITIPGIALTVLNGLSLASSFGGTQNQPWLFYSMILLFIMWAISIPLIYYQELMYKTIDEEPDNEAKIHQILIKWGILGTIVTIPPMIVFYLMIVKNI